MTDQTVYRVTFADGSTCHYGVESLARAAARQTGQVETITVHSTPAHLVQAEPPIDIDDRYAGRLALLLECMLIDPNGHWNEATQLLDEYKAAWEAINPQPPTFMGEPMPPERKARLMALKAERQSGCDCDGVCRQCGTAMQPGKAIAQTYSGHADFIGGEVVTMSPGGPGKLIDVRKCPGCGWSVSVGEGGKG